MLEKMKEIIAEQLSVEADTVTEASSFKEDSNRFIRNIRVYRKL